MGLKQADSWPANCYRYSCKVEQLQHAMMLSFHLTSTTLATHTAAAATLARRRGEIWILKGSILCLESFLWALWRIRCFVTCLRVCMIAALRSQQTPNQICGTRLLLSNQWSSSPLARWRWLWQSHWHWWWDAPIFQNLLDPPCSCFSLRRRDFPLQLSDWAWSLGFHKLVLGRVARSRVAFRHDLPTLNNEKQAKQSQTIAWAKTNCSAAGFHKCLDSIIEWPWITPDVFKPNLTRSIKSHATH